VAGHAGLFSNVPDLLRFAREILAALPTPEGSASLTRRRSSSLPSGKARRVHRGRLGWDTPSENSSSGRHFSPHSIGHLGFSGCSLWIDLEAGIAVVLLTNRTWPDRQSQLIRQVRPAFHERHPRGAVRLPQPALPPQLHSLRILFGVDCFADTIKTWGLTRC
jgi:CubicO group peptidase (beta-lactamase class C family)